MQTLNERTRKTADKLPLGFALTEKPIRTNRKAVTKSFLALNEFALFEYRTKREVAVPFKDLI